MALAGVLAVSTPATASAHATLLEATPAEGVVVTQSPRDITLRYDESVGVAPGAIKVLAPDGSRVELGEITTEDQGRLVVGPLPPDLEFGTYTVLWRVLSEDTHSIFGATTFSVGEVSSTSAVDSAAAQESEGIGAQRLLNVSRGFLYAGVVLLLGGLMFMVFLWPGGRAHGPARRVLLWGWGFAVAGTASGLLLQGPFTAGEPLSSVLDIALIGAVLDTRFGVVSILRLLVLVAVYLGVLRAGRTGRARSLIVAGIVLALSTSVSAVGHAGAGSLVSLALPIDVLHVVAASSWLGGLAMLLVMLRRAEPTGLASVLSRWSRYAGVSVIALVLSGSFTAWRQVREIGALFDTEYGRLLLVKLVLVVAMLGVGAACQWWIRRQSIVPRAEPVLVHSQPRASEFGSSDVVTDVRLDVGPLRRRVGSEAAVSVLVVAVTAVLVASTPAKDTYFPVFEQIGPAADGMSVDVAVSPARIGVNSMTLAYRDESNGVDVVRASARWTSESGEFLVPVEANRTSSGIYEVSGVTLPVPGMWKLAVTTQTSDIDSTTTLFTVQIR